MTEYQHTSVLVEELKDLLAPQSNGNYIDLTLGGGGHSQAILEKTGPDGKVLAFELDGRAISASQDKLKKYQNRLIIINSSYVNLQAEFNRQKINISGIVADLGLSSDQLDKAERGFSFKDHGSLDMRFDPNGQTLTASDIVTDYTEEQILKIFQEYGEVKQAKRLARGLVSWRKNLDKQKQKPIKTSMLVGAILQILNIKEDNLKRFRIHPATQVFQALRIAVNDELNNLKKVLPQAYQTLPSGGRLAVISFHSLEDRLVKTFFRSKKRTNQVSIITKRPIRPNWQEIKNNRAARSAKLRIAQKL